MKPDRTLKDHYNQYQDEAKRDLDHYTHLLALAHMAIKRVKEYVSEHIEVYRQYGINLEDYKLEYEKSVYNNGELYQAISKVFTMIDGEDPNKPHILQLIKYCNTLKNISTYKNIIHNVQRRKYVSYTEYRRMINDYYNKVQEALIEGFGYSFSSGIGDISITRFKTGKSNKKYVDLDATAKAKKALLEQGKIPYDPKEAEMYKARGFKYPGVPYIVYDTKPYVYSIQISGTNLIRKKRFKFESKDYVHESMRGMGSKGVAAHITSREQIYNLRADIRFKLNVLLEWDKTQYIKFIRNVTAEGESNIAENVGAKGGKVKRKIALY